MKIKKNKLKRIFSTVTCAICILLSIFTLVFGKYYLDFVSLSNRDPRYPYAGSYRTNDLSLSYRECLYEEMQTPEVCIQRMKDIRDYLTPFMKGTLMADAFFFFLLFLCIKYLGFFKRKRITY